MRPTKETMGNSDDRSPPEPAPPRQGGGGFRALLQRFRRPGGEPEELPKLAEPENRLVRQAEAFQTLRVDDVMTPRADIVAVELSTPFGELVERFIEAEHSRMPIYRETLDDPVGVVHVKDVFRLLSKNGSGPKTEDAILHRIRRDALYVPASMRAADLLLQMQATRLHMALVIDEFGGTDGLVTLEDLIEELVGEISDEYDRDTPDASSLGGGVYRISARLPTDELGELFGVELDDDDVDSAGGLLTKALGRLPERGASAVVSGISLRAERVEGRRKLLRTLIAQRDATLDPPVPPTPEKSERSR